MSGLGALPFGFIQFIHDSGEKTTISCMDLLIQEESMDLARQANELEIPIDFEAETTVKKLLSEWTYIELRIYFKFSISAVILIRLATD